MIDLYLIRYFLAVVESGNFTRAANSQNVTQPTLSAGIKKLEENLGRSLFERTNKRVFLTQAGTSFLPHAKAILHELNMAEQALADTSKRKMIKLGVLVTLSEALIQRMLIYFADKHPDYDVELIDGTERELLNRLDEGSIDYGLTLLRKSQKAAMFLYEERYCFVVKSGTQGSDIGHQEFLSPDQLKDRNMIVRSRCEVLSETSRYFTSYNVRPRFAYRTRDDSRALAMVSAGIGGTLCAETVLHGSPYYSELDAFRLEGFDHHRKIGLFRSQDLQIKLNKNTGDTDHDMAVFEQSIQSFFRDSERSGLNYLHYLS